MPQSIRFFFRNRWNRSSTLISSSGERTNYEADLTKSPALAETWRSNGATGAYISANFGTTYKIGAVCLVRCNLVNAGQYRVRVGNTSDFSTNLYDSGWVSRSRYYSDAEISIAKSSEFFPNGLPISDMWKRIQRQIIVVALPSEVTAQYVRIDFDEVNDTTGVNQNVDGYVEVGYVYAGRILEPSNDLLYGWKIQREDFVRNGQAACGQYWPSSVYNKTLVTLSVAPQNEVDVTGYWILMESLVGINDEFIVSLMDRTDTLLYTTTIYGRFIQAPGNVNAAFRTWNLNNFLIEEIAD